jgi:hypothetical protein
MKTGDDGSLDAGAGSSSGGRNTDLLTQLLNSRDQQPFTQANSVSLKQKEGLLVAIAQATSVLGGGASSAVNNAGACMPTDGLDLRGAWLKIPQYVLSLSSAPA